MLRSVLFFFIGFICRPVKKFQEFFNQNETADPNKDTCGILTVEGRTFPVDMFYTIRYSRNRQPG